jgi:general L-amino acid transport system permease protein
MKLRSGIQLVISVMAVTCAAWAIFNFSNNLQSLGKTFGFTSFGDPAGFPISETLPLPGFEYSPESSYWTALAMGFLNTIKISLASLALASALGLAIGIARLSENREIRFAAASYVTLVRSVPVLLQLILIYVLILNFLPLVATSWTLLHYATNEDGVPLYGAYLNNRGLFLAVPSVSWSEGLRIIWNAPLPSFGGRNLQGGFHLSPEYLALFLGLGTYSSAYIAEIVRGGILSVDRGQREAARALGMNEFQTLRYVILPQAWKVIVPPLTSQFLSLTKNSSLGVAVGYPELVAVGGTILNQTGRSVEVIIIWMSVYLSISLAISLLMSRRKSKPDARLQLPQAVRTA